MESLLEPNDGSGTNARPVLAHHPVYQDFAHRDVPSVLKQLAMDENELEHRVHIGRKEIFPVRLYKALEGCSTSPTLCAVMCWLPHGRAFKIYDKRRFIDEVLPLYFHGQRAYGSFQRQLNMYGLLKLTGEHSDHGAYYHPLLLRGRPLLCHLLVRRYEAECAVRRGFDPRSEPNFYCMPPMHNATVGPNHNTAHSAATLCNTQRTGTEPIVAYGINNATAISQFVPSPLRIDHAPATGAATRHEPSVNMTSPRILSKDKAHSSSDDVVALQLQSKVPLVPHATKSTISPVDVRRYFVGSSPFMQATATLLVPTRQPTINCDSSNEANLASELCANSNDVASCSPYTGMYPLEYLEPYHHFANVQVCDEWKGGDVKPVPDREQLVVDQTMRNPSYATYEPLQKHKTTQIHPASDENVAWNTKAATALATTHPSLSHSDWNSSDDDWNSSDDMLCRLPMFEVDFMGIEMSVEDAVAPCDRDVYQELFS